VKKIFAKFSILEFIFISFLLLSIKPVLGANLKLPFSVGEKWKITQGYEGMGWDDPNNLPTHRIGTKDQYAIDFSLPGNEDLNKPILATIDGIAHLKKELNDKGKLVGYGQYIDIDLGNGFITRYAHLLSYSVNEGDSVKQGQEIGRCDNTGYKGGSHLHFAMYQKQQNGKFVAYKPEPMSEYETFVAGNWYTSDNEFYQTKFVENENITWWGKFLGAINGFLNNVTQPAIHFVSQTNLNNQSNNQNQEQIWQAEMVFKPDSLILKAGESTNVLVKIKNIGNQIWQSFNQVSVNVFNQEAKNLYDSSWRTRLRPVVLNSVVAPGQTADFYFQIQAPNNPGNYLPSFQIVYTLDNSSFETLKSDLIFWQIIVRQEQKEKEAMENQILGSLATIGFSKLDDLNNQSQDGSSVSIYSGGGGRGGDGERVSNEEPYDTDPPETTLIINNLPLVTNNQNITFEFSVEGAAIFECKIDDEDFQACVSAKTYENLTEGSHNFQVRAIDLVGNVDSTPAQFSWTIDLSSPIINFTSQPSSSTNQTSAQFEFSSNEEVVFKCSLDDSDWEICTSPKLYENLVDGVHLFSLRAKDSVNNYSQPIDAGWVIDVTAPEKIDDLNLVKEESNLIFSWSKVTDNLSGLDCYEVAWWKGSDLETFMQTDELTFIINNFDEEKSYYFKVRAADLAGNQAEWSEMFSFEPTPFLENWQKRKIVMIDNTQNSNELTNFEVNVPINYQSEMNNNFSDIRFSDEDGQTLLNYGWEINDDGSEKKEEGIFAEAVVRVPSILSQTQKKIYLYYGNTDALPTANLENTLIWLDHFQTNRNYDYDYRDVDWQIKDSRVKLSTEAYQCGYIMPKNLSIKNLWLKVRMSRGKAWEAETRLFWRYADDNNTWEVVANPYLVSNWGFYKNGNWTKVNEGEIWNDSTSYIPWEVKVYEMNHSIKVGEIILGNTSDDNINQAGRIRIYDWWRFMGPRQPNMYTYVDYLYIRQYTDPMPSISF
jgi:murein DD-endopeptidase MepM/ murein hydrolase activator NlpD